MDSTILSHTVKVDGKQDVEVRASHIVGDADVTVKSEGNLIITSVQEESGATHLEEVRKSGIFGNGGLSLTIGTQKQADTYDAKSSVAKGSVIGSRFGSVTLGATESTQIEGSDIASKGDIQVQGSGVTIRNGYTTSHTGETHRFSKSGLTLSVSNRLVDTTTNAIGTLKRASAVKDERLQALLAYKTYDDAKTSLEKSKLKDQAKSLHLNLSLGTEKSEASTNVDSKIAKGSTVVSDRHIRVATKKDDIRIAGSDIRGKDITLESANSIYVKGKEMTSKMTQNVKQKQGSLGISYDVLQHRFSDISLNASGSKGNIAGIDIVHDPSNITARNTLGVNTKQDLNIKDGVLKGEAIEANVGGNLEIHSVQDTHDYTDHTTSGGMGLSLSKKGVFKSLQSSVQRTDIDSKYTSVVHRSGLYAGHTGFNISVGNTTTLEGALLASRTDTNTLKTKQLVMKDMENRAKYTYESKGVSYLSDVQYRKSLQHIKDKKNAILSDSKLSFPTKIQRLQRLNQDKEYTSHLKYVNSLHNQVGLLPNILPGERKEVYSVTKSAIAPGTIDVENPKVDLSQINRDINHSLQALDTIFNKQDIQERQELTKLFNKYANEAIHHISDITGWKEGSSEKVALHAIVGNISANMVHGNTNVGTATGGLSELLAPVILEASNHDPAKAQWLAYALGYATDKLAGGTGELGGSISHYGIKWNGLSNYQQSYYEDAIYRYLVDNNRRYHKDGIIKVLESAIIISNNNKYLSDAAEPQMIDELEESARILGLNYSYNYENGLTGEMIRILEEYADKLPKRDIISVNGGIGVGLGISGRIGPVRGDIGASSHLDYDTSRKGLAIISKIGAGAEATEDFSLGANVVNVANARNIRDNETTVNINLLRSFNKVSGASLYTGLDDTIFDIGGSTYVGAGGEASLNLNFTAMKDKFYDEKKGKELLEDEVSELKEEYNR